MPADDILGKPRDSKPDIGAYERAAGALADGAKSDSTLSDGAPGSKEAAPAHLDRGAGQPDATMSSGGESGCGCTLAEPVPDERTHLCLLLALLGLAWRRRRWAHESRRC